MPGLIGYTRRLRRHVRLWQPDLVHANGLKGHILSAWVVSGRMRLLWHVHDYVSPRAISAALFRRFSTRADTIVANSKSVAADVESVLGGDRIVKVLHNGIDNARFSPEGPSLDLDAAAGLPAAPAGTVRIGLVATYAKWKGHEIFLDAVSRLRPGLPVRAYVVGGPAYQVSASQWTRADLNRRASELGLDGRVGFLDFQPETSPVYRSLDVVVHASTAPEPFGLVIAEAMSCGRPVVISDAGGAREIGEPEQTCVAHPPGDVEALARQMERLINDSALRSRLGAARRCRRGQSLLAPADGRRTARDVPGNERWPRPLSPSPSIGPTRRWANAGSNRSSGEDCRRQLRLATTGIQARWHRAGRA